MGSIEAMYYQVRVPEEDRDFLRFYWLFEKAARSLLDVCSSFRDSFFTQLCTVNEAIHKGFYVDDFLDSVNTVQEAVELIKDTSALCSKGGF